MDNQLMHYLGGNLPVPRADRFVTGQAKQYYDEVRLAAFKAKAVVALTDVISDGITELDARRHQRAGEDLGVNMTLAAIQANAVRKLEEIQNGLFRWPS